MLPLTHEETAALKGRILSRFRFDAEITQFEFIPNPVTDRINCRLEVSSAAARKSLVDHYQGIVIGASVYLSVPRYEPDKH